MKTQLFVLVLAASLACACDRHSTPVPTAPTGGTTPPPANPAPTLVRVNASGTTTLSAVGETSQLTATGQYSDGTTSDLTRMVTWTSSDPVSMDVSSVGLVTVRRLGTAYVYFNYQGKQSGLTMRATPAGTFILSGRVREPGNSGLSNAAVQTDRGEILMTNSDGLYSTGGLSGTVRLSVSVSGFEPVSVVATPDVFQDIAMQRVVRLSAGEQVSFKLAPHDMEYLLAPDVRCFPCRMVRVSVGFTGTLELTTTWTESRAKLNMWVKGRDLLTESPNTLTATATVQVTPGELELYVGSSTDPNDVYIPVTVVARVR